MTKNRILVVDDDRAIRELLTMALEMSGYLVTQASSAEHAKIAIQQQRFDLVLLDLVMPQMDGQALLRWLRTDANYANKIVMITSIIDADIIKKLLEVGADQVLAKPVKIDTLNTVIEQHLR